MDPAASLPCAMGTMPAATAAPAPPLEPPGVTSEIPGIARRRMNLRLDDRQDTELARGRFGQNDEAAAPELRDDVVVDGREELRERARPEARERAARQVQVFDGDRHAEKGRGFSMASGELPVGGASFGERAVTHDVNESAQARVEHVDAFEARENQVFRRNVPSAEHAREFERGGKGQDHAALDRLPPDEHRVCLRDTPRLDDGLLVRQVP